MPPRIYKSGRRSINFPVGASYDFAGTAYLGTYYSSFTSTYQAGQNSLNVLFPTFSPEIAATYSDISFNIPFNSFTSGFNVLSGGSFSLNVAFQSFDSSFSGQDLALSAYVAHTALDGLAVQQSNLSVSAEVLDISLDGLVTGIVTITSADQDAASELYDALTFSGDTYLVLNLKNKAHSIYMDGNNNALAEGPSMNFSNYNQKNVTDAYLYGRSTGDIQFIANTDEVKERTYEVSFGVNGQANLINKKIPLAKGISGSNWTFKVTSPSGDHLDIRALDLLVKKLNRRV